MKLQLLSLSLVFAQALSAQVVFRELSPLFDFAQVQSGTVDFADVNGDGYEDVLITGKYNNDDPLVELHIYNGVGGFTKKENTPFVGVYKSSVAFSDVDNDGDQDVLIAGNFGGSTASVITKLYTNNGLGDFTEIEDTPFVPIQDGEIAFSDVNNDGYEDVFVVGDNEAKLYINEGMGNFVEAESTLFPEVMLSSVAVSDVNNDGYDDVLITGQSFDFNSNIAKLYINDGTGDFTEEEDVPFQGVSEGTIAFSDVNNDGYEDVLIMGRKVATSLSMNLYLNDGAGNFTEEENVPFTGTKSGDIAFSDVNGDGYDDVLVTGEAGFLDGATTKLYINNGSGDFTEMGSSSFQGVYNSSIAFSDVNRDGYEDVIITGHDGSSDETTKLYINDGTGHFTEKEGILFEGVSRSAAAFSDIDNDGYEDILITGSFSFGSRVVKLYKNDGDRRFTEITDIPFEGIKDGDIAFSDVNNDGYEDVLITGDIGGFDEITKLYMNDGSGNFTEFENTPFVGVNKSSVAFSDVNNDGYEDVFITGNKSSNERISELYMNDGSGVFLSLFDAPFEGVENGAVAFSDLNNDGHQEILITGLSSDGPVAKLYTNHADGSFSEIEDTPFLGVDESSVTFVDVNGDGYDDVFITGKDGFENPTSKLYINDGSAGFSEMTDTPFVEVRYSSVSFADVNNDGYEDVLITGANDSNTRTAKLYTNDGLGNFTEIEDTPFYRVSSGALAFSDVDNDGDQDVLITGNATTKLYINETIISSVDNLGVNEDTQLRFTPFPNPSQANTLFLAYTATKTEKLNIEVYNTNGVLLQQQREQAIIGEQTFSVNISSLAKGSYFVTLNNGDTQSVTTFIVQ